MTTTRLHATTKHYRSLLHADAQHVTHQLETHHAQVLASLQTPLDALYRELDAHRKTLEAGAVLSLAWLMEHNRLQTVKRIVTQHIDAYSQFARSVIGQSQHQAIALGTQTAQAQLAATIGPGATVAPPAKLVEIARTETLTQRLANYGADAAKTVGAGLLLGVSLNWTIARIKDVVAQALDVSRWQSLTVALTGLFRTFKDSVLENYRANSDTLVGWRWICTFSGSCAACIAMHGSIHSLDEDLWDHPNGACFSEPVTAADALVDFQSGDDWFDEQDASVQLDTLGPGKFALYQDGTITLDDLVGIHDGQIYEKPLKAVVK